MSVKKTLAVVLVMIFTVSLSSAELLDRLKENSQKSKKTEGKTFSSQKIYTLRAGEEFVYGKIGLFNDGRVKYTLAVIRKPNAEKPIYEAGFDPYEPRPLGEPLLKLNPNPKPYEQYDFFLIFNGVKYGPFDRILDMDQNDPDTDDWVSHDGKNISFSYVVREKYYPYVNGFPGVPFWTTDQAPVHDPVYGQTEFAMEVRRYRFRLFKRAKIVLDDWMYIGDLHTSEDGSHLLYVGGEATPEERYVYINHEKKAGPYYIVFRVGFIPGTDEFYCAGFDKQSNYKEVILGEKRVSVPDGTEVTNFNVSSKKIVFTLETPIPALREKIGIPGRKFEVVEYDIASKTIRSHGPYFKQLAVREAKGDFYFWTLDDQDELIMITPGGRILERFSVSDPLTFWSSSRVAVTPQGDWYIAYKKLKDGGDYDRPGTYTYALHKNGALINEFDAVFAIAPTVNEKNGAAQFQFYADQTVASVKRIYVYGDKVIRGEGEDMETIYAPESLHLYSRIRTPGMRFRVNRDGRPADEKVWNGLAALAVSGSGDQYAALATEKAGFTRYWITPDRLDADWKLVVNGKVRPGRFGAPVWSHAAQNLLVLEQKGTDIFLTSL